MKDGEANAGLIRHVTRRLDEFFDENDPTEFNSIEDAQRMFSRWLRHKEAPGKPVKLGDGMVAQEVFAEDIGDQFSATLAFIKLFDNGRVGIMWSPMLFDKAMLLPDELRDDLIELLRFHAKKLEDRSLDERMRECAGKMTGTA